MYIYVCYMFLYYYTLREKRVLQWFFRMIKGSTCKIFLSEPV